MSLLREIKTADNRTSGWEAPQYRYLLTVNFNQREQAEEAFDKIIPYYEQIWANGTVDGVLSQGRQPEYANLSFGSKIWVDENPQGFDVCVYFTNSKQMNEFLDHLDMPLVFGDLKLNQGLATLNESERIRIDRLETATHSVELDVPNVIMTPQVTTDFMNVAITLGDGTNKPAVLYADTIAKDGFTRLKAYFPSAKAAEKFNTVCDTKVRKPLTTLGEIPKPKIREFKKFTPSNPAVRVA
jgi:hypothetical protein